MTGGRELTLTGATAKDGSFGFTLPATDLFDSAFLAEHGRNWPHDLFGVRGAIDAPHVRVPNVEEWRRLAAEGGAALEKAVHEFGGP